MATVDTIASAETLSPESPIAVRIERARLCLFKAMSFVQTTRRALDQHDQLSERDTLSEAFRVMDSVAAELNDISGINGPLPEEETEEVQS